MKKVILSLLLLLSLSADCAKAQGILWSTTTYSSLGSSFTFKGFTVDKNGNTYVCGQVGVSAFATSDTTAIAFGSDTVHSYGVAGSFVVFSVDSSGNYSWVYHSPGVSIDQISGMTTDIAGNIYLLGNTNNDSIPRSGFSIPPGVSFLLKMNNSGAITGEQIFGSGGLAMSIDSDNNIYLTGGYQDSINVGGYYLRVGTIRCSQMFIAKLDTNLRAIWAHNVGGDSSGGFAIAAAKSTIYVAGSFDRATDTIGGVTLTNANSRSRPVPDFILSRYDSSGHLAWVRNVSELDTSMVVSDIATDAADNIYFSGNHQNPVVIGTDTINGYTGTLAGMNEAGYLIKYNSGGFPVWGKSIDTNYTSTFNLNVDKCNIIWTRNPNFWSAYNYNHVGIFSFDTSGNRLDTLRVAGYGFMCPDAEGNLHIAGSYDTISATSRTLFLGGSTAFDNITVTKYKYGYADCSRDTIPINTLKVESTIAKPHTITLYPNPATETCTLAGDAAFLINSTAQVFDASGRLVTTRPLPPGNPTMDVSDLRPGVYLVKVTSTLAESVVVRLTVVR